MVPTDEFYPTYVPDFLKARAPDGDLEASLCLTLPFNTVTALIDKIDFKSHTPAIKKWENLCFILWSLKDRRQPKGPWLGR